MQRRQDSLITSSRRCFDWIMKNHPNKQTFTSKQQTTENYKKSSTFYCVSYEVSSASIVRTQDSPATSLNVPECKRNIPRPTSRAFLLQLSPTSFFSIRWGSSSFNARLLPQGRCQKNASRPFLRLVLNYLTSSLHPCFFSVKYLWAGTEAYLRKDRAQKKTVFWAAGKSWSSTEKARGGYLLIRPRQRGNLFWQENFFNSPSRAQMSAMKKVIRQDAGSLGAA